MPKLTQKDVDLRLGIAYDLERIGNEVSSIRTRPRDLTDHVVERVSSIRAAAEILRESVDEA